MGTGEIGNFGDETKYPEIKLVSLEVPLSKVFIPNPQLWHCETTKPYSAEVTLILDGKMIDKLIE